MQNLRPDKKNAFFEVSLKVILKNDQGETLLLKLPKGSSMEGYYDLLGGRFKEKEEHLPFRELIRREVEEEIGEEAQYTLNEAPVSIGRHYYFSKRQQKVQYIFWVFFEAQYLGGSFKISSEHAEYEWVKITKRNLKKYFIKGSLEGMQNYIYKKFVDNEIIE